MQMQLYFVKKVNLLILNLIKNLIKKSKKLLLKKLLLYLLRNQGETVTLNHKC